MLRRPLVVLVVLLLAATAAVYRQELRVVELRRELADLARERTRLEGEIRTLRASLAWLTRPARLAALAPELGMVPARAERIVPAEAIDRREGLEIARRRFPVPLPSGYVATLRARPPLWLVRGGGRP